jgi:hypothetical protein
MLSSTRLFLAVNDRLQLLLWLMVDFLLSLDSREILRHKAVGWIQPNAPLGFVPCVWHDLVYERSYYYLSILSSDGSVQFSKLTLQTDNQGSQQQYGYESQTLR